MFKGKTVLITGATGLLGTNLSKELLKQGARVIALGRSKEKILSCFSEHIKSELFEYVAKDISEDLLEFSEPIDLIFHAAGSIELSTIINKPLDIILPAVQGSINCLELLKKQEQQTGKKGRFIYFSSEAIYGKENIDRYVGEKDTEISDSLQVQRAPYSHSKRMGELIVNGYVKQYDCDALNVRLGWIYGNAIYKPKQALYDFIYDALSGKDIMIKNGNTPRRDNLYMTDAISGLLTVAEKGKAGEVYNISSNGEKDNFAAPDEIAKIIAKIVNEKNLAQREISVNYENMPSVREGGIKMNNDKLKSLGWSVTTSLAEGMEKLIEEIKNNVY